MIGYPYESVEVNGRAILLSDIAESIAVASSEFETAVFSFIRQWVQGVDSFPIMTSGSTGTPKIITITREQMISSAMLTAKALALESGSTALLCLDASFIAGRMMIVRSFVVGMKLIAIEPSSEPLAAMGHDRINFCAMVPMQVFHAVRRFRDQFTQLGKVIIGGGSLDSETLALLQDMPCACYATYGMTETISHVALMPLNGTEKSDYYHALPGITLSTDTRACLVIHWKQVVEDVITNDIVRLMDDARFMWLGRWDNVINTGGKKINPEKLEEVIQKILVDTGLSNRFIISHVDDPALGNKIVLVIEGDVSAVLLAQLRTSMVQRLKRFEIPKNILFCTRFIETVTGKINRKETLKHTLPDRYSSV